MPEWKIAKEGMLSFVEINLTKESVRTEAGALRFYQGPIEMKTPMPSLGGFFKAKMTGEKAFRPVFTGTGHLMLEASFHDFFAIELEDETFVLDRGAYWASDMEVEVTARMNKLSASMFSGEGIVQTAVKGTGTVIVRAPGQVQRIDLRGDRLVVDGSFAVARSASLDFSVQPSTRSIFGSVFSGEMLVSVIQGTGTVYLAPLPNQTLVMQELIERSINARLGAFATGLKSEVKS